LFLLAVCWLEVQFRALVAGCLSTPDLPAPPREFCLFACDSMDSWRRWCDVRCECENALFLSFPSPLPATPPPFFSSRRRYTGGAVVISSGPGNRSGGAVSISVGVSGAGPAGVLTLSGGTTSGAFNGGDLEMYGGDSAASGTGKWPLWLTECATKWRW
jgi:hypothetical protein